MRIFILTLAMLSSACGQIGIEGAGCPYPNSELEDVALRFVELKPDAFAVLDRTDVLCVDEPYFYVGESKAAGVTLWPGSGLMRARVKIAADLDTYPTIESSALAHELLHLYLWDTTGDPCYHNVECGWDEELIRTVNNGGEL
jgi:hypothetical protein